MEHKFSKIYEKGTWGKNSKGEGTSGTGSKFTNDNKFYVKQVLDIIESNNITNVCDIGCGDWEIAKHIDWDKIGVKYTGIDIVKDVVERNQEIYGSPSINFKHGNILEMTCENYDLVLIKDVLQHMTDEDVCVATDKLLKDNSFLFMTNGYKFGRTPEKNNWSLRDINNKYSYHPLDIDKKPLHIYCDFVFKRQEHRYKQMILMKLD